MIRHDHVGERCCVRYFLLKPEFSDDYATEVEISENRSAIERAGRDDVDAIWLGSPADAEGA
jgi:hypothetical protein